jgi:branched-chain amino acid transport system substrate-binding protein
MMKRFFISAVAWVALMMAFQACKEKDTTPSQKTINIRGLFSLTGNWSSLGLTSQAALDLAAEDINAYLASKNSGFRIAVSVSDTKLETDLAKTFFTKANNDKISFIIGPQSSAELAAIKPLSDSSQIIVISQSSTASSMAIANDAIFRFCPGDKIEGAAMAATIAKNGFKGLVTIARDDAGNKGLQTSTGAAFIAKGGQIATVTPYATNLIDYSALVASIKTQINTLIGVHGADKVGIYLASFDEGIEILKLAAADPILGSVNWFGGDGVVLSTAFLSDTVAAKFVIKTSFFAPAFGLPVATESQWKPVADRIKAKTGTEPDAFALAAYDAMWTIVKTIEANNGRVDDFIKLKTLFMEQANKHSGIMGAVTLDAAGDRANGTFDYFSIAKQGNSYVWKLVGKSE